MTAPAPVTEFISGSGSHQKHFWIMREGNWNMRETRRSWSLISSIKPEKK